MTFGGGRIDPPTSLLRFYPGELSPRLLDERLCPTNPATTMLRAVPSICRKMLLISCLCTCSFRILNAEEPVSKNGVIDLRGWNFSGDGIVELNGEWEFHPQRYYGPDAFRPSASPIPGFVHVPGSWTKVAPGTGSMPVFGYATYRLKIVLDTTRRSGMDRFALGLPMVFSAYRLWIDTILAATMGNPAADEEHHTPLMIPVTVPFINSGDTVTVILQVANYFAPQFAGLVRPVQFGTLGQLIDRTRLIDAGYLGGAAFALMLGLFFLFVFALSHGKTVNILFAGTCLIAAMRFLLDRPQFLALFMPHLDETVRSKLLFLCLNFFPLLLWIARTLFPDKISKGIAQTTGAIYAVYSFILIAAPFHDGAAVFVYATVLSVGVSLYVTAASGLAYREGRESAGIFFFGMIVCTPVFAMNMLASFYLFEYKHYFPTGMLPYLVLEAAALTKKFVRANERAVRLSTELKAMNDGLERIVAARTSEIHQANLSLQKLNASKDRFISILSHDLRNPLYGLVGLSRRLMRSAAGADRKLVREHARIINESAVASQTLVENLLDWSLVESGSTAPSLQRLMLNDLVDETLALLKNAAAKKKIMVRSSVEPDCIVSGDRTMVLTILRNLLTNAVKFTRRRGTVEVSAVRQGELIVVSVADSGVGMLSGEVENLFRIDRKVLSVGTDDEPGSGYGLLVTKQFVEAGGGTISVTSMVDKGTTISFTMRAWSEE